MSWKRSQQTTESVESLLTPILRDAYGLAYNLSWNGADAEDLVQDAALRALRYFGTFEAGTNFKAWFYRILTNVYFEKRRKEKRRGESVDLDDASDLYLFRATAELGFHQHTDDPGRALMRRMTADHVREALQALPDQYAVVATLYFMEDMTYRDIADTLGLPVGTVRSRLHRGRAMLQKALWTVAVDAGIVSGMEETA